MQLANCQQDEERKEATSIATQPITQDFPALPKTLMLIGSEVIGECVEEARIEVGRKMLREIWCVLSFWVDCDGALTGLSSGCVDGDGARYWKLIY